MYFYLTSILTLPETYTFITNRPCKIVDHYIIGSFVKPTVQLFFFELKAYNKKNSISTQQQRKISVNNLLPLDVALI